MYQEQELNLGSLVAKERKEFKRHKIVDGDNFYRILPPFGTNHGGSVFAEWYLHWGFTDSAGRTRPLVCTKRSERYCPICDQANKLYEEKERLIADYKDSDGHVAWGKVPEEIKAQHKTVSDMFGKIKASRYYYYNAVDQGGTVGILALPKTAKELLNAKILEAVQKYGFNPVSLSNGCYFVIRRVKTGASFRDIEYQVDFMRQITTGADGITEKIVQNPLPPTIVQNFENLAYDVHSLYLVRTAEQVKRILNGDSSAFDENEKKSVAQKADVDSKSTLQSSVVIQPVQQPAVSSVVVPKPDVIMPTTTNVQPAVTKVESVRSSSDSVKDSAELENLKKLLGYK